MREQGAIGPRIKCVRFRTFVGALIDRLIAVTDASAGGMAAALRVTHINFVLTIALCIPFLSSPHRLCSHRPFFTSKKNQNASLLRCRCSRPCWLWCVSSVTRLHIHAHRDLLFSSLRPVLHP